MKRFKHFICQSGVFIILTLLIVFSINIDGNAFNFPAADWHRGNAAIAHENSRAALTIALDSANPNIELDISGSCFRLSIFLKQCRATQNIMSGMPGGRTGFQGSRLCGS